MHYASKFFDLASIFIASLQSERRHKKILSLVAYFSSRTIASSNSTCQSIHQQATSNPASQPPAMKIQSLFSDDCKTIGKAAALRLSDDGEMPRPSDESELSRYLSLLEREGHMISSTNRRPRRSRRPRLPSSSSSTTTATATKTTFANPSNSPSSPRPSHYDSSDNRDILRRSGDDFRRAA